MQCNFFNRTRRYRIITFHGCPESRTSFFLLGITDMAKYCLKFAYLKRRDISYCVIFVRFSMLRDTKIINKITIYIQTSATECCNTQSLTVVANLCYISRL